MRGLRILLLVHAVITFAAGVTLFAAPAAIPGAVGVMVTSDAYLVCYLLAAAELAIAYLSLAARRLPAGEGVRTIVWTFIVLHATTGAGELYAFARGTDATVLGNVALRLVMVVLFARYGLRGRRFEGAADGRPGT